MKAPRMRRDIDAGSQLASGPELLAGISEELCLPRYTQDWLKILNCDFCHSGSAAGQAGNDYKFVTQGH